MKDKKKIVLGAWTSLREAIVRMFMQSVGKPPPRHSMPSRKRGKKADPSRFGHYPLKRRGGPCAEPKVMVRLSGVWKQYGVNDPLPSLRHGDIVERINSFGQVTHRLRFRMYGHGARA